MQMGFPIALFHGDGLSLPNDSLDDEDTKQPAPDGMKLLHHLPNGRRHIQLQKP
jgi:hypothetical protein